jgi:hypothetical protein
MDSVALSTEKYGLMHDHAFLCSTDNNTVAEQLVQADCYTERLLTFEETVWMHAHVHACMQGHKISKRIQLEPILFFMRYYKDIIFSTKHS